MLVACVHHERPPPMTCKPLPCLPCLFKARQSCPRPHQDKKQHLYRHLVLKSPQFPRPEPELGAVQMGAKSLQRMHEARDSRWIQTDREGRGNDEAVLASTTDRGLSTSAAQMLSSIFSKYRSQGLLSGEMFVIQLNC